MTHFTFTGQIAGKSYCGEPRNKTDKFIHVHLGYITKHRGEICPKCLAIYENCGICENDNCEACPVRDL